MVRLFERPDDRLSVVPFDLVVLSAFELEPPCWRASLQLSAVLQTGFRAALSW